MASRIIWVLAAGGALAASIVLQDGDTIFGWGDHDTRVSTHKERTVQARVERPVERGAERMRIADAGGHEVEVSGEAKALTAAIARLVEAEVAIALLGARDADAGELAAANARGVQARAEVDRLKDQIAVQQHAATDRAAVRAQIQRGVREDIRASIRDAVGN